MKTVVIPPTFEGWRDAARRLIADDVSPVDVDWREEMPGAASMSAPGLFDVVPAAPSAFRVPRAFLQLAGSAASHPDPTRWKILYAVLYRLAHGEPELLASSEDADVNTLRRLAAEARDAVAVGFARRGAAPFVPATEDLEEAFARGQILLGVVTFTATRPVRTPSSGRARSPRKPPSWASSRATRRISRRSPFRRSGRRRARPSADRGGLAAHGGLGDECREAFQVRAHAQAATAPDSELR